MPTKAIFAIASAIFQLAIFVPYYINISKKKANPHLFSWLTWGTLTGLGFVLLLKEGGGYGAWIFGLQSVLCLSIAVYAIFRGEKNITRFDWLAFTSAIIITIFYAFTNNAILSVIFAAAIDALGFAPTYRKSYMRPSDEPALTYFFSFLSFLFLIGALQEYNFVTLFYPLTLLVTNSFFVLFLLARRKTLATQIATNEN